MFNYYTFEGPIISLDDSSGVLSTAGLNAGDKVRYTFLIDRSREGIRMDNDGSRYVYDNDRLRVYFYTKLVNDSIIYKLNQCNAQLEDSTVIYNRGFESDRRFDLLSGSNKHYVNIWGVSINSCPEGMALHGLECVYDNNAARSVISSKLSLISISDHCPEPADNDQTAYAGIGSIQQYFQL
jgi:hypothetical protein